MEFNNKTKSIILQRSKSNRRLKHSLSSSNSDDCLTDAFITIYKNSIWCAQSIYEILFKSLWQVLLFTKEDVYYNQNENHTMNSIDIMSINNSAGQNYSKKIPRKLPRHHRLEKSNSQQSRQKIPSKINMISNKTRVTVRSISNQNLNHTPSTERKNSSNNLGTINSHIIVVPVPSSQCQNMTTKHDLSDVKQSVNINLREQLADTLCRRSYEPLMFMNRGMCCGHCRPFAFPNVPFHHSGHYSPPMIPQQQLNKERELSQKSTQMGDASETQSTVYSASPSIQSHITNSLEDEPLSNGNMFYNETNEQNQSILSFPEHETSPSPSEQSQELVDDDSQLKLSAHILVDDSIQDAQEKYQRIARMSVDQDPQNNTLDTIKQMIENQSKSILPSDETNKQNLSDDNRLCQELCNKLNLSDSNQISEIIRIIGSNAPHILKEQPSNLPNKNIENNLCNQLLLHPPFKPKRLIHLCPDGSIQVLSAVDENSNENQKINQQQYQLNYSNSAVTPSTQQNHILTNESALALEYETTTAITADLKNNFNHMTLTESESNQQSYSTSEIYLDHHSIVSLQQKKTLFKYHQPSRHPSSLGKKIQLNNDHSKTISQDTDPIVQINLDLNDETTEMNSENDDNSLPEIFFKRIIAPESSIIPLTEISNQRMKNKNDDTLHMRRTNHQKSRHNRSRSHSNKKSINIDR